MSVDKKVPEIRFEVFSGKWEEKKLGELAEILRGASPRPIEDPKWFDSNSSVGWLRIRDVTEQDGRISYLEQRISKLGQEKTRVLHTKSLLLSIAASVGKPVINYVETGVHDGFLIFKKPFFELEFMYQWLKSFEEKWKQYGQPGSQVNLNSDIVKSQSVTLPTKKEQTQIGDYFQKLDTLINQHQKKHDKLCNIKKAMLEKMFPKQGKNIPEIRFKGFSDEWKETKLFNEAIVTTGFPFDSADFSSSGTFLVITNGNIQNDSAIVDGKTGNRIAANKISSLSQYILNIGDILVTMDGTVGRTAKVIDTHQILAQRVGRLVAKHNNEFLYQSLNTGVFLETMTTISHGGTIKHISLSEISNYVFFIPKSLEEQVKIGCFLKQLDNLIAQHQQQITKLNNIKQACLSKMFV
ncbi:hypothetical protein A9G07_02650 [Gilliamella sp. wkB72]|uniref:restriction endonuclease subunit S n=1 Tax=Gilliamella sp. wkB72 TaxID=3120265 RepID=UPI000810AAAD|nr:restriction endonuclease subunit S [Gilliamella apicola]OCL24707.1 hypothetical protein A9G07_02650 [Gilliamella apicola]